MLPPDQYGELQFSQVKIEPKEFSLGSIKRMFPKVPEFMIVISPDLSTPLIVLGGSKRILRWAETGSWKEIVQPSPTKLTKSIL
ncbi:MAG TPA: hypothetical protein DD379_16140 [Cyanobacteria bacterium UBA11162]|nr:hypothetical protein [Cyanobacteria bacterium UBA11162]